MRPVTRAARGLALFAVAAIALAGCAGGQPQPREYGSVTDDGSGYYGNFMLGCTGVEPNDDGEYVDEEFASEEYCRCVFEGMKETVPFADARAFEEAQAEAEPGADITVPSGIRKVMDECDGGGAKS